MFFRSIPLVPLALTLCSAPVFGLTIFTNAVDTDFNNAANWDNGVPDGTNGAARINDTSVLSADYNAAGSFLIVGRGATGSLDIPTGLTLTNSNGVHVGRNAGNGTLTVAGTVTTTTFDVGSIDSTGSATFTSSGTLNASGNITVTDGSLTIADTLDINAAGLVTSNGTLSVGSTIDLAANVGSSLYFESGATFTPGPLSIIQNRNGSTLGFAIDGSGHATLAGASLQVRLGSTASLQVDFLSTPTLGQTFDLITGVEKFTNFNGSGTGFEFGSFNVTGLDVGQNANLIYDTTVADAGFLRVEIVPEPGASLLVALSGLTLLRRRR